MSAVFRDEPLSAILEHIKNCLTTAESVHLDVLDPDHGRGLHAGETLTIAGELWRHRPLRVWVDLAARLGLRLCTPRPAAPPTISLRFERLAEPTPEQTTDPTEKYGADAPFARIIKLEDPDFIIDLDDALDRVALPPGARVLELGVNRGDLLAHLAACAPNCTLVGVDHSRSALALARARLPDATLHLADLADLASLDLGTFDLILALDTLQSSGLDDRALLRRLVQAHLTPRGSLIIGLPNCRYHAGEMIHGARMRNFRQPELGLIIKDLAFYRKYLQQHGRTVYITGHHELLLTAVPI